MKLYDRIMADDKVRRVLSDFESLSPDQKDRMEHAAQYGRGDEGESARRLKRWFRFYEQAKEAVVFDVSNVAAYVQSHGFDAGSIPRWVPPSSVTWWETSHSHIAGYEQIGAMARCHEDRPRPGSGVYPEHTETTFSITWEVVAYSRSTGIRWISLVKDFPNLYMMLGPDGTPRGYTDRAEDLLEDGPDAYGLDYKAGNSEWEIVEPFLMAIGFCHCRNVEIVNTPELPYKVRRKRELKLGRPLAEFKELVIDPHMTQKRVEGATRKSSQGSTKSLHIARGHFATYSEERPLFGKYTGTFWRPAHVRGSAEVGTVYKDYKVKP